MDGDYERAVTGKDVLAAARVAGLEEAVFGRLAACIADDDRFHTGEDLAATAGPAALGLSDGRWNAIFAPVFGEFE